MAERVRPEGGGGDYGSAGGGYDHRGFGTLMYPRWRRTGPLSPERPSEDPARPEYREGMWCSGVDDGPRAGGREELVR
ncbi:hypothetical protein ACH470_20170 [Streptomyces bottropensis]|uniref:hypothetical protein n=1 Tax=Streptomyces bottropensis TaxID=42235 RepID=UPI0037BC9B6A